MPVLAIQHFFILFEILRSLYADVDVDVRSGAELLDKKLKDVIVHAINSGTFTVEACVPVFARFVYIRNKVRTYVHVRGGLFCGACSVIPRGCLCACIYMSESKLVLTPLLFGDVPLSKRPQND